MPGKSDEPVTKLLARVSRGERDAAMELLPLVYGELRRLAAARMRKVPPGNTLQPTALVHEAYLRLVGSEDPGWNGRGHFFGAAAEAMRQILVDQARRKSAPKHGGDRKRLDVDEVDVAFEAPVEDILALNIALEKLEEEDPRKAAIVKLRFFAGLDRAETASALGVSLATVDRDWRYILARLHREIAPDDPRKKQ